MQKIIYCGAIALLFIIVIAAMWFLPIGRDLQVDKDYLHQSVIPNSN
ncbi:MULTISPECIES: hypothetical protein [Commensalibacter]|uniref:Uncharacterized protein n=1 Tax=Commensalibacter papalotli (ex Botero et al. 2024) TaxID=2972766 RepID=A0ABM9HKG2_9PROT|nr:MULTISPECIES: hypothetical protein [Commensalibacter]CAI3922591.1 unnamed protein product [Commensalibacter papalotli (ex Botero et al. 2024)]CAI3929550.1 unnamed protein product [Commensalibacter papalotli (ex Botero et al. 2024)]